MRGIAVRACIVALCFMALAGPAVAQELPRAVVADFANNSGDRHASLIRFATDAVALELTRAGVYSVVAQREVDRAGKTRRMEAPYREEDITTVARDLDAPVLVLGEIHHVEIRSRGGHKVVEVGLVVRVKDVALGELINGAAERGIVTDSTGGTPDISLIIDAATNAAARAAMKIAAYRPVVGTILNTGGNGPVVMNRGLGHGVRKRQEFVVLREGHQVGRLRVLETRPSYSDLTVVDGSGGIRPEDKAIAVFPEPRFGK